MSRRIRLKTEYLILGVVILALLLYLILRNPDRMGYEIPDIPQLAQQEMTRLVIEKDGETLTLQRGDGDRWRIQPQGYPADADKVTRALGRVADLQLTDVVSESRNYPLYGLDEKEKIVVRTYKSDTLLREMAIGKQAATYRHTYVKLSDDPRVFHARDSFRSDFASDAAAFRDKQVMTFDTNEIASLTVETGGRRLGFNRSFAASEISPKTAEGEPDTPPEAAPEPQHTWTDTDGKPGNKEAIDRLVEELANLSCTEYIEGKTKDDYQEPLYTVLLKGNREYTLNIFAKAADDRDVSGYPAISSENDYPFILSTYTAEQIQKKPDELMTPAESPVENR